MHLACMDDYRLAVSIKDGVRRDLDMRIFQRRELLKLECISLHMANIAQFSSFARYLAISGNGCIQGVERISVQRKSRDSLHPINIRSDQTPTVLSRFWMACNQYSYVIAGHSGDGWSEEGHGRHEE